MTERDPNTRDSHGRAETPDLGALTKTCPGSTPDGWTLLGKTAAADFSGVTDAGEPFAGSFTTLLYECPTCKAVVAARDPHEEWHRNLVAAVTNAAALPRHTHSPEDMGP